jgi:hypothetical protein
MHPWETGLRERFRCLHIVGIRVRPLDFFCCFGSKKRVGDLCVCPVLEILCSEQKKILEHESQIVPQTVSFFY